MRKSHLSTESGRDAPLEERASGPSGSAEPERDPETGEVDRTPQDEGPETPGVPEEGAGGQPAGTTAADEKDALAEFRNLDPDALLEIKKHLTERDLFRDELLRARADLDNYQKRVRRERPNWEDHAVRRFLGDILPVLDNFELALTSAVSGSSDAESLRQGIRLIYQMLEKALRENGVEEIPALGEPFNPEVHEAVAEEEVEDQETGRIVGVQQKGYLYKGVVVRPSRVTVAKRVEKKR